MKLILIMTVLLMVVSSVKAETTVLSQYLKISGDTTAISPSHKITIAAGSDVYTEAWNVTKSEFQSLSLKMNILTAAKITWYIEAMGIDADGNEYWQRCSDNIEYTSDKDRLISVGLPVNSVFRIHLLGDAAGPWELEILTVNRK